MERGLKEGKQNLIVKTAYEQRATVSILAKSY